MYHSLCINFFHAFQLAIKEKSQVSLTFSDCIHLDCLIKMHAWLNPNSRSELDDCLDFLSLVCCHHIVQKTFNFDFS